MNQAIGAGEPRETTRTCVRQGGRPSGPSSDGPYRTPARACEVPVKESFAFAGIAILAFALLMLALVTRG